MFSPTIEKLITLFSKFPTVGPRTAARFVFYLIKTPKEKVEELIRAITDLKNKIKICPLCFNSFESERISEKEEFCPICSDPSRDKSLICLVEKEVDLETVEKTKKFKGIYFVLGGTISGFEKEKEKKKIEERVEKLIERVKGEPSFASAFAKTSPDKKATEGREIILALNPTPETQQTIFWLQRKLKPLNIKITQLGRGLPVGGELEYADEETISSALKGRR
ncbi:MAG: recombination mediator RecR [Patescibacteria group bacterium]|nr:recombination mediator RecR [Patescibacteria group bacterium]